MLFNGFYLKIKVDDFKWDTLYIRV